MSVCEFLKNNIFWTFDSIYDGHSFIIVFEASNPVVNNREDLPRKSTKKAAFHNIKSFFRTVIH